MNEMGFILALVVLPPCRFTCTTLYGFFLLCKVCPAWDAGFGPVSGLATSGLVFHFVVFVFHLVSQLVFPTGPDNMGALGLIA